MKGRLGKRVDGDDRVEWERRIGLGVILIYKKAFQRNLKGFFLSGKRDSNPRPLAWKANALSTELFPQNTVGGGGFEPPKS